VPSRTYAGKPWRFVTSNVVCATHREKRVDPYLDEESWKAILNYFDGLNHLPRPWRSGTRVEFEPIEAST
jgi:hypothetical protein